MVFPLRTIRRRSTDLPWLNKSFLNLIKNRKKLFVEEGGIRTATWKDEKKRVDQIIKTRKRGYMDAQRDRLLVKDANRNFFRHVKSFSSLERPKEFDIRSIVEGTDKVIAEKLCLLYTSPSPRDRQKSRMPSSA